MAFKKFTERMKEKAMKKIANIFGIDPDKIGPDEALEILDGIGIHVELTPIPLEVMPASAELEAIASAAVNEGHKFVRLVGNLRGVPITAFAVLGKPSAEPGSSA